MSTGAASQKSKITSFYVSDQREFTLRSTGQAIHCLILSGMWFSGYNGIFYLWGYNSGGDRGLVKVAGNIPESSLSIVSFNNVSPISVTLRYSGDYPGTVGFVIVNLDPIYDIY